MASRLLPRSWLCWAAVPTLGVAAAACGTAEPSDRSKPAVTEDGGLGGTPGAAGRDAGGRGPTSTGGTAATGGTAQAGSSGASPTGGGSGGGAGAANGGGGAVAGNGAAGGGAGGNLGGQGSAPMGGAGSGGQGGTASERCASTESAYFVDSASGDDANDGRTPEHAWKTLTHPNATTFAPGDALCLKAGTSYTGELHPLGSGSSSAVITLEAYGEGARPKIAAGSGDANALSLVNQEYWDVSGLELTNEQSSLGDVRGISIRASNAGTLTHLHVRDCFVHDVSGEVNWIGGDTADDEPGVHFKTGWDASKRTGGIVVEVDASVGTSKKTYFDDVLLENNVVSDTSFGGIVVKQLDGSVHWGIRGSANDTVFAPHTNVVIRNNFLSQTNTDYGCNAVYLTGVRKGLVEGNVVKDAGTSGIELYYTDAVTVQKNEVFGTVRKANGADYNGIDTDKATTGSIIQYNYVHDNGDGILLCQFSFGDSIVRYNLIINSSRYGVNMHSDAAAKNATYNNLFYSDGSGSASLVSTSGDGSALEATYAFSNNIFHTTRTSDAARTGSGVSYRNNLYSGPPAVAGDTGAKTGSPGFVDPSSRMSGSMAGPAFASLGGFKLQPSSPALEAGITIDDNGGQDFWGTPLYEAKPDIGPYEAP